MKIISHRGNLEGPDPSKENDPRQIEIVLATTKFLVEVDLWINDSKFELGHDYPEYPIDPEWLLKYKDYLVIHAKDVNTANTLYITGKKFNWFFHNTDDMTLTSQGWIWSYPGVYMTNGIVVELGKPNKAMILNTFGVCTDYPLEWQKVHND